jgi:GT2 family glycosyltransferase
VGNGKLQFQRYKRKAAHELKAVEARNAELTRLLQAREHQLRQTMSSRSWRITRPLRLLGRALMPIRIKLLVGLRIRKFFRKSYSARYNAYVKAEAARIRANLNDMAARAREMTYRPHFSIVVDGRFGHEGIGKTLDSIDLQIYPYHSATVFVEKDIAETVTVPKDTPIVIGELQPFALDGDFLIFLKCGERLAPNALYEFASRLSPADHIDMIYADEDQEDANGKRHKPFHKPDWSPDYLESFNYIGFASCFRRSRVLSSMNYKCLYDFILQFTEHSKKIVHLPEVLGHRPRRKNEGIDTTNGIAALEGRLARTNRRGVVRVHPEHPGCYEIKIDMVRKPLVSIIIPTAGKETTIDGRKIDLITNLLDQIRTKSTYKHIEIIVVDNGDLSAEQITGIDRSGGKRVTYQDTEFNVARKLNLGASIAVGELLLLLNDDIEILTPSWIERMAEHFEKPNVGVVGAKLLYVDKTLQHVGVILNRGIPDHVRRCFPRDDAGYFFSTCGVRNYSAVTGACMMVKAQIYRSVGGYSEDFAVSYNDVDFCLKVIARGLSVVYAPAAELVHMESQSRVPYLDAKEHHLFEEKWGKSANPDRFYNENFLTVFPPTFEPTINF